MEDQVLPDRMRHLLTWKSTADGPSKVHVSHFVPSSIPKGTNLISVLDYMMAWKLSSSYSFVILELDRRQTVACLGTC